MEFNFNLWENVKKSGCVYNKIEEFENTDYISTVSLTVSSNPFPKCSSNWRNLKTAACVLVWTENILKTGLFKKDDITIIKRFPCQSFPQTQIQNDGLLLRFPNVSSVGLYLKEPIPLNTANEMTAAKFRISSYFAQIPAMWLVFENIIQRSWSALVFLEIQESSKIAIIAASRRRKWPKIVHFLFARTDQREHVYQYILASSECIFCCF